MIKLSEIIERSNGQTALANKLKVIKPDSKIRQGHINNWLKRSNGIVPPEWVLPVCEADEWHATPHELRPDLYPHPQDGLPEEMRSAA
jgi:hypothetical protein